MALGATAVADGDVSRAAQATAARAAGESACCRVHAANQTGRVAGAVNLGAITGTLTGNLTARVARARRLAALRSATVDGTRGVTGAAGFTVGNLHARDIAALRRTSGCARSRGRRAVQAAYAIATTARQLAIAPRANFDAAAASAAGARARAHQRSIRRRTAVGCNTTIGLGRISGVGDQLSGAGRATERY